MMLYQKLKETLAQYGSFAVAYSGGLDSSVLLKAASEVCPSVTAVTYHSVMHPVWEKENAAQYAAALGVRFIPVSTDIIAVDDISSNLPTRCYYCKRVIYRQIISAARDNGLSLVLDGSNADDYRASTPGVRAARELGIISPLAQCGITKQDILRLADLLGIPMQNRATYACLASRLPAGERLTADKLRLIERAELLLHSYGYDTVRVRMHSYMARIELPKEHMQRFMQDGHFDSIYSALTDMGFEHVCIDMGGYTP